MTRCLPAPAALLALLLSFVSVVTAEVPHVNWENHPVRALDLSPDGRLLAVAHTADHRVLFFDVSGDTPQPVGSVPVGLDPVAVRFRTSDRLWVVNHISDSVSIVDVSDRRVINTVPTADEPFDVAFAGNPVRAFVSASQSNHVQVFDPASPGAPVAEVAIAAEDPRALAVSPDGQTVYVAIFESGNGSTILAGSTTTDDYPANVTRQEDTPYGGENPPPNSGNQFDPPIAGNLLQPPRVGQIVRKDDQGRWMDDNGQDWTRWVSGNRAADSDRPVGWDLPDRDLAVIDANTLAVSYVSRLMTTGMALAVNPSSGAATLVGTDAFNELRFEPNVNGRFLTVNFASVETGEAPVTADLNPHLNYQSPTIPGDQRRQSLGDPRGIAWTQDGSVGFVTGMGSNTVLAIDGSGARLDGVAPIDVGAGPTGVVLDAQDQRLFVWNHFDASLTTIDVASLTVSETFEAFSPLPSAIVNGRPHFYDTHATSGLGQIACASCHVDTRTDRLAWDLGDPSGASKTFNQNCQTDAVGIPCRSFHPMKGPMLTQTLQDIIGHEPFHWRGDRDGLEEFNGAFQTLQGSVRRLQPEEMQQFEDFLATVTLPPNPFRNLDNSLPTNVPLPGHVSAGKFSTAGTPMPNGNAERGLDLFMNGQLYDPPAANTLPFDCTQCHSLPTGMSPNGQAFDARNNVLVGGSTLPDGPNGENHLGVVGNAPFTELTFKVPQLRTLYDRVGFDTIAAESASGFGFLHDGSVDTLTRFMSTSDFLFDNDQQLADMVAFMLSFSGSDLPLNNPNFQVTLDSSQDSHAAVGQQVTVRNGNVPGRLQQLANIAVDAELGMVAVQGTGRGSHRWALAPGETSFVPDDGGAAIGLGALAAKGTGQNPVTFTTVPAELPLRLGGDRDGDGVDDGVEIAQGSNPANPDSSVFLPTPGHWFNPARSGHGMDLQRANGTMTMVATWYTYNEDGTPHWYQANGTLNGTSWTGDLYEVHWVIGQGSPEVTVVGTMTMDFSDPGHAQMSWTIGNESGSEPFQVIEAGGFTPGNYTGHWFDTGESGWGVTLASLVDTRITLVFFYDDDGNPRWVIGTDSNADGASADMLTVTGFCPWCTTVPTQSAPAGTLKIDFDGIRSGVVDMAVDYPGNPGSLFERVSPLTPISNVAEDPLAY